MKQIIQINVNRIDTDPNQPRSNFDEEALQELAQSIKKNGLLQPITVKETAGGKYMIVVGERRYRAVCSLGWETIDCILYNGNSAKELQLIENINRADLNPMEVALAYQAYLDVGHTVEELAEVVGKAKGQITWSLSLLKLREDVQHLVKQNQFPPSVAGYMTKLSLNGQAKALNVMTSDKFSVSEGHKLCALIYAQENQSDMFPEEIKLTPKEAEARRKLQSALEKACAAFNEINSLELNNPGITAQAIAEKLDITKETVDMLYQLIGRFKQKLEVERVAALC